MNEREREATIATLEQIFTYLGCSDVDLSHLDGAYPALMCLSDPDEVIAESSGSPSQMGLDPFQIKVVGVSNGYLLGEEFRSVHWSEVRHGLNKYIGMQTTEFDCFAEFREQLVSPSGVLQRAECHLVGYRGSRMHFLTKTDSYRKRNELEKGMSLLSGMAYYEPTYWVARVKYEDAPSVSLITDPTGIKELWKFRDLPEGRQRRASLLHWVSEHWRVTRNDPDVEAYVRKHLRGAAECSYRGFTVQIKESREASVEAMIAARERSQMKHSSPRRDRRKRFRKVI